MVARLPRPPPSPDRIKPIDAADAHRIQALLRKATGVVLATPECHGTFAAFTKLIIENLGDPSASYCSPPARPGLASSPVKRRRVPRLHPHAATNANVSVEIGWVSILRDDGMRRRDG